MSFKVMGMKAFGLPLAWQALPAAKKLYELGCMTTSAVARVRQRLGIFPYPFVFGGGRRTGVGADFRAGACPLGNPHRRLVCARRRADSSVRTMVGRHPPP